jgi:perosamine synthetase
MNNVLKRIGEKEKKYVMEVLDTDFRSSKGSMMMTRLEETIASIFGVKYAISHINGTATLHSAIAAAGVRAGDEVIVPPLTMSSTAFSVLQNNGIPVFADVDEKTFNISTKSIEKCITKKTKAIMPVSLYGLPCDSIEINRIANQYGLVVIEDNAECFMGKINGIPAGKLSDMASFSFQSSKHLTSGEGGIIITNNEKYANQVRKFSSLGYAGVGASKGKISKQDIQNPEYERHCCMGWNYRMPELCAAVVLGQLEHYEDLIQRRKDVAEMFIEEMKHYAWITPQYTPEGFENSYWTLAAKLDIDKISWESFRNKFIENGGDGVYSAWQLSYLEPMFRNMVFEGREIFFKEPFNSYNANQYSKGICPVAEKLQPRMLQFKTNYWDFSLAEKQANALKKTLRALN